MLTKKFFFNFQNFLYMHFLRFSRNKIQDFFTNISKFRFLFSILTFTLFYWIFLHNTRVFAGANLIFKIYFSVSGIRHFLQLLLRKTEMCLMLNFRHNRLTNFEFRPDTTWDYIPDNLQKTRILFFLIGLLYKMFATEMIFLIDELHTILKLINWRTNLFL